MWGGGASRKWGWKEGSCCCLRKRCLKGVGFECLRIEPGTEGVTERLHKRHYLDVGTRCIRMIVNARHVYVWFWVKVDIRAGVRGFVESEFCDDVSLFLYL